MKAYAILDGGGVLGSALVGCLKAAEQLNIEFVGFAGTSAGSIVALLAAMGYSADELRQIMVEEINFRDLLDDDGTKLEDMKRLLTWQLFRHPIRSYACIKNLLQNHGLYTGAKFRDFLFGKVKAKLPGLTDKNVDFQTLQDRGFPLLKIVATDIGLQRPHVFGLSKLRNSNEQVIDAVRASIGYPFVFNPVGVHSRRLVDGGLCSNLPVFVFDEERKESKIPIIAFDLVKESNPKYPASISFKQYCFDMINSSLESHDILIRDQISDIIRIVIPTPHDIDSLDFSISRGDRDRLYEKGLSSTLAYFATSIPQWGQAETEIERLQALRRIEPDRVQELLGTIAKDVESKSSAKNVRCSVMLPSERNSRLVVYHYGMEKSADVDLEIPLDSGCSGLAWSSREPAIADLSVARMDPSAWKLTQAQHNKVPDTQNAMISIPLFDLSAVSRPNHI